MTKTNPSTNMIPLLIPLATGAKAGGGSSIWGGGFSLFFTFCCVNNGGARRLRVQS